MMRMLLLLGAWALMVQPMVHAADARGRIDNLTLERAIELAEQHHPDFAEARALRAAAEARQTRFGKLPNPEAVARIESAPLQGRTADAAEYVAGISQSLPLGGRLSAEREVARREGNAVEARSELKEREARSRVHGAFATALYFDAALQAFSNNLAGATALTLLTKARVEAGDALREDLARMEMDAFQGRVEMNAAEAARRLAMRELAVALGDSHMEISSVAGSLDSALAVRQIESAAAQLNNSPAVLAAESEAAASEARLQLAKAQRIPDLNFDLFYRRLQESRQDAFDAGIRVPIPLFSGARIREAKADAESAQARAAAARLSAQQQFGRALAELNRALESARLISTEVLPRAQLVLTNAETRYKLGDESLANVLQKRRDWNATQTSYLQTLRNVHDAWRDLSLHLRSDVRTKRN